MDSHVNPIHGDCEAVERACAFEQIGCSNNKVRLIMNISPSCLFKTIEIKFILRMGHLPKW